MKKIAILMLMLGGLQALSVQAQLYHDTIQVFSIGSVADGLLEDDGTHYEPSVNPTIMTIEYCASRRFLRVYDHGKENMYVMLEKSATELQPHLYSFLAYDVQNHEPVHWIIDWKFNRIGFVVMDWKFNPKNNWLRTYRYHSQFIRIG